MRVSVERLPNAIRGMALILCLAAGIQAAAGEPRKQPRPHGGLVAVPVEAISIDDGDSVFIIESACARCRNGCARKDSCPPRNDRTSHGPRL